jgi:hypothetical protein
LLKYPVPPPGASETAKSSPTLAELFEGRDTSVFITFAFATMPVRDQVALLQALSSKPLPIRRERDRLIREAASRFFPAEGQLTRSAKDTADALGRYRSSADWQRDRHLAELPASASARRRDLHAILRANKGTPLGWRQIYDILTTERA